MKVLPASPLSLTSTYNEAPIGTSHEGGGGLEGLLQESTQPVNDVQPVLFVLDRRVPALGQKFQRPFYTLRHGSCFSSSKTYIPISSSDINFYYIYE
jgi:hypothetical protein